MVEQLSVKIIIHLKHDQKGGLCGGVSGNSLYSLNQLLVKKNLKLSYCKVVTMPDNSGTLFGSAINEQLVYLNNQKKITQQITSEISQNIINTSLLEYSVKSSLFNLATDNFIIKKLLKKSVNNDICNNCGICQKVCFNNNIKVEDGKIKFGNSCTQCLACIHWCPNAAIRIMGHKIPKNNQYHHPEVSVKEMFRTK